MCGRFTHLYRWSELHRLMTLTSSEVELPARYNVAPTQNAPVVIADPENCGSGRRMALFRWGLVPAWADDERIGNTMINARAEGIQGRRAFGSALRTRRCIVPVSGFYEWKKANAYGPKQPYYITASDGSILLFAGLWERWSPPDDAAPLHTFTIITTAANRMMSALHDRMPAILDPRRAATWLDTSVDDTARLTDLLVPSAEDVLTSRAVSMRVNSPRHDDARCLDEAPPAPPTLFG